MNNNPPFFGTFSSCATYTPFFCNCCVLLETLLKTANTIFCITDSDTHFLRPVQQPPEGGVHLLELTKIHNVFYFCGVFFMFLQDKEQHLRKGKRERMRQQETRTFSKKGLMKRRKKPKLELLKGRQKRKKKKKKKKKTMRKKKKKKKQKKTSKKKEGYWKKSFLVKTREKSKTGGKLPFCFLQTNKEKQNRNQKQTNKQKGRFKNHLLACWNTTHYFWYLFFSPATYTLLSAKALLCSKLYKIVFSAEPSFCGSPIVKPF